MEKKLAIGEGTDVYGSDGKHGGRVGAVGAKYVTIVAGLLGQHQYHLPIALVARASADRVELAIPLVDARAQALRGAPPADEPIYREAQPIPEEERGAVGLPIEEKDNFGLGPR